MGFTKYYPYILNSWEKRKKIPAILGNPIENIKIPYFLNNFTIILRYSLKLDTLL